MVLNERGLDRALAAGIQRVNTVVVVTETFSGRNQGMSVDEALAAWSTIAARAHTAGLLPSITVAAAFGCPYEGKVEPDAVLRVVDEALAAAPTEITLADTIGAAVPSMVEALVGEVVQRGGAPVRCHLHDTRNTGVANAVAAVRAGAVGLDASLGGLGGCPFAPGATGNVATEDVAWCLEQMGFETGVDLPAALDTVSWMREELATGGRQVGGAVFRAGPFPRAQA
jgi:hydroxymethylglutaryl-CoA lyase